MANKNELFINYLKENLKVYILNELKDDEIYELAKQVTEYDSFNEVFNSSLKTFNFYMVNDPKLYQPTFKEFLEEKLSTKRYFEETDYIDQRIFY